MQKVEVNAVNYARCNVITSKIDSCLREIAKDTGGMSTHIHTLRHPKYKELTEMGTVIIPYLFHVVMEKGWSWTVIHLLRDITGEEVVPKEYFGRFYHMAFAWLQWYLKSDYSKENSVYYGLIENETPKERKRLYETEVKGKKLIVTDLDLEDVTVLISKINDAGGQVGSGHDLADLMPSGASSYVLQLVSYIGGPTWNFAFNKITE